MLRPHAPELVKSVADEKHNQLVEVSLHALSALLQWDPSLKPTDKLFHAFPVYILIVAYIL